MVMAEAECSQFSLLKYFSVFDLLSDGDGRTSDIQSDHRW